MHGTRALTTAAAGSMHFSQTRASCNRPHAHDSMLSSEGHHVIVQVDCWVAMAGLQQQLGAQGRQLTWRLPDRLRPQQLPVLVPCKFSKAWWVGSTHTGPIGSVCPEADCSVQWGCCQTEVVTDVVLVRAKRPPCKEAVVSTQSMPAASRNHPTRC